MTSEQKTTAKTLQNLKFKIFTHFLKNKKKYFFKF